MSKSTVKPKGGRRPGAGRPKGSKNKTVASIAKQMANAITSGTQTPAQVATMAQIALKTGYDPIEAVIAIAMDETNSLEVRLALHQWLAPWFRSKPREDATVVDDAGGRRVTLVVE